MEMRRLIAVPGFVLLAIGSIFIYFGIRASHFMGGSATAALGFFIAIVGAFFILLSGIFKGIIDRQWGGVQ